MCTRTWSWIPASATAFWTILTIDNRIAPGVQTSWSWIPALRHCSEDKPDYGYLHMTLLFARAWLPLIVFHSAQPMSLITDSHIWNCSVCEPYYRYSQLSLLCGRAWSWIPACAPLFWQATSRIPAAVAALHTNVIMDSCVSNCSVDGPDNEYTHLTMVSRRLGLRKLASDIALCTNLIIDTRKYHFSAQGPDRRYHHQKLLSGRTCSKIPTSDADLQTNLIIDICI